MPGRGGIVIAALCQPGSRRWSWRRCSTTSSRLPPGPARDDVLELGERAGVEIGEVYRIDASRRSPRSTPTSTGSARPSGSSSTTTCSTTSSAPSAARSSRTSSATSRADIPRGMLFVALVDPAGAALRAPARRRGRRAARGARAGPARLLAGLRAGDRLASSAIGVAGNQLSRAVEAQADAFALELTDDPRGTDRAAAAAGGAQPLRSRPAGLGSSSCSAPTRRDASGSARALAWRARLRRGRAG